MKTMTHGYAMGFLMGAVILITAASASAQRWGREGTPRAGVCFYEHRNFEGRYFCSPAGAATSEVPSGTNDRISSIRLFGSATVRVFRDVRFRGESTVIVSSITDLRRRGFNDRISSYRIDLSRGFDRDGDVRGDMGWRGRWEPSAGRSSDRDAEAVVRRGYQSVLGREPEPSGLQGWTEHVVNNNWTQRDFENALRRSDEYRAARSRERR